MAVRPSFWERDVYRLVVAVCVLFLVLTVVAMLLYPGGTPFNHTGKHYDFFDNFFSDLGQTRTPSGQSNIASLVLFVTALTAVAVVMVLFFVAFVGFFSGRRRRLSRFASLFGCVTAICFVGVAATPWDLYLEAHNAFVKIAFPAFLVAVLLYTVAILLEHTVPQRFAWVFIAYAVILAAYVVLILAGPDVMTSTGRIIQVAGQKVIVYASVVTVLVQAFAAATLASKQGKRRPRPAADRLRWRSHAVMWRPARRPRRWRCRRGSACIGGCVHVCSSASASSSTRSRSSSSC